MSAYPPRFETLDSLTFGKGESWSAHRAKALEFMRLRLRNKEQGLPSVAWPLDPGYDGDGNTHGPIVPFDSWVRVVDPIAIPKCRIGDAAMVVVTYVAEGPFVLQVSSKGFPFNRYANALTPDGIGFQSIGDSPDVPDATSRIEVPLLRATEEELMVHAFTDVTAGARLTMLGVAITVLRQTIWSV